MSERTWEEAWADIDEIRRQVPHASRWRHKKRGTEYEVREIALHQDATGSGEHDMELVVVYYSFARESFCTRRVKEVLDGRFERIR